MRVAVVAHMEKRLGGGLPELRRVLASHGVEDPLWYEVPKAKRAPDRARRALKEGADLVFAWGGDGTVRRCVGELAGTDARLAVLPAGTANLFATNLGIPADIEEAVRDRAARRVPAARRRPLRRRALRGDGGRGLRRRDDPRVRRPQGAHRPARLRRGAASRNLARGRVRGGDRGRRPRVVRRPRDVHPARQRRRPLRGRHGLPRRRARRRAARAGRRHRRGRRAVGAHARADRRRRSDALAVRAVDEGAKREGQARPQGPLRARRRGSHEGQGIQGQGRAGGAAGLRPAPAEMGDDDGELRHAGSAGPGGARPGGAGRADRHVRVPRARGPHRARGRVRDHRDPGAEARPRATAARRRTSRARCRRSPRARSARCCSPSWPSVCSATRPGA